jgi:hypothetical protein
MARSLFVGWAEAESGWKNLFWVRVKWYFRPNRVESLTKEVSGFTTVEATEVVRHTISTSHTFWDDINTLRRTWYVLQNNTTGGISRLICWYQSGHQTNVYFRPTNVYNNPFFWYFNQGMGFIVHIGSLKYTLVHCPDWY